jgi:hypothetical protein
MIIPILPLIAGLLPVKGGVFRAKSGMIQRHLFGQCWATIKTCKSHAEATRIVNQLNEFASR